MHYTIRRFRRNLLIIVLALILTVLVAAYTKGLYKQSPSIRPYMQSIIDWSRHSVVIGKQNSSLAKLSHKRDEPQHGYVVAISLSGQQGAGIQALTSLQCWVSSFNLPMVILEPIMSKTVFVSIPRSSQNSFLTFSDLFDIQHFNRISESLGYTLVATREQFFSTAPRNAIFVHVKSAPKNISTRESTAKVFWRADEEQTCYQFEASRLGLLAKEQGFCFVRIVEAICSHKNILKVTDQEVREVFFGDQLPQQVTLFFNKWETSWYVENDDLDNPFTCKRIGKNSSKEQFLPSPRLVSDAKYYETHFLQSSNEVALMLRIEHVIHFVRQQQRLSLTSTWTVDECLTRAFKMTKEMQMSGYPMVTMDIGKFGSASLSQTLGVDIDDLSEKSKLMLTELYENKLTFEEWEESFTKATGGVEHSGYIAALQRTLASRAKCLILVGGGNFQDLALKDYLKKHPNREDQCIHLLCVKNEIPLTEVMNG